MPSAADSFPNAVRTSWRSAARFARGTPARFTRYVTAGWQGFQRATTDRPLASFTFASAYPEPVPACADEIGPPTVAVVIRAIRPATTAPERTVRRHPRPAAGLEIVARSAHARLLLMAKELLTRSDQAMR